MHFIDTEKTTVVGEEIQVGFLLICVRLLIWCEVVKGPKRGSEVRISASECIGSRLGSVHGHDSKCIGSRLGSAHGHDSEYIGSECTGTT